MDRILLVCLGIALILVGLSWQLARLLGSQTLLALIAGYLLGSRERKTPGSLKAGAGRLETRRNERQVAANSPCPF
jgi:hypothetical protein